MKLKVNIDEILTEERLALLPDLTKQEKKALAWCIVYTGMQSEDGSFKKKCAGHFYRSNNLFKIDLGMEKSNSSFTNAIAGLVKKGLLKRRRGSYEKRRLEGVGASEYIIPDELTEWHPLKNRIEDSEDFTGFSLSDLKVKTKVGPDNIDKLIIDNNDKDDKLDKQDKLIIDNNEKLDNEIIDKQNKLEKTDYIDTGEKLINRETDTGDIIKEEVIIKDDYSKEEYQSNECWCNEVKRLLKEKNEPDWRWNDCEELFISNRKHLSPEQFVQSLVTA